MYSHLSRTKERRESGTADIFLMSGQGPHGRKNEAAESVGDSKGSGVLSSDIHIPSLDGGPRLQTRVP